MNINTVFKQVVIVLLSVVIVPTMGFSQISLFSDDFESGQGKWNMNSSAAQLHGKLSVAGGENLWVVNNDYNGTPLVPVPNTNLQPAGISANPRSNYLHIVSRNLNQVGVKNSNYTYLVKGPNEYYFTHMAAPISTTGLKTVTFSFWWLNYALTSPTGSVTPADSSGQVFYSLDGGTNWLPTPKKYVGDSIWQKENLVLPAFDNQASLMFGFAFLNPDTGFHPGFAIDAISLTGVPTNTPTANFNANKTLICLGDTVEFTDLSTGTPTRWHWSFGTGNAKDTSNLQNPKFPFTSAGKYSITLTVSNVNGSGAPLTKTNYITVVDCNQPPKANFSMNGLNINEVTICAGDSVFFADSSGGNVASRYWAFPGAQDDSGKCRLANDTNILVTVFYPCAGSNGRDTTYTVTLNVSGNGGADFLTKRIKVKACIKPVAKLKGEAQRKICKNNCVTYSYDASVEKEYFITEKPAFKWYFWGINDSVWADYGYSPTGPSGKPGLKDTVFTTSDVTVCYADSGLFKLSLVTENVYGKDSIGYEDIVSVYGFPTVNATTKDEEILKGYSTVLSTEDRDVKRCSDLNEIDLLRGDSCCCYNYYWSYIEDGENITTGEILNWTNRSTRVRPGDTRYFYVIKENYNKCRAFDSVLVTITEEFYIGAPDIFTPNRGHTKNKRFYVFGNRITKIDVNIYNRYGQVVYFTDKVSEIVWESDISPVAAGWNGSKNNEVGKELDPGVYTYWIRAWHENGDYKELKGNVTLVR